MAWCETREAIVSHHSPASRGFSLLELQVGLLLMTLVIVGFTRLVTAQESLVRDLEAWCRDDPVFYVVLPDDEHERAVGMPAALRERPEERDGLTFAPSLSLGMQYEKDEDDEDDDVLIYDLQIKELDRDLEPQRARALVKLKRARR